MNVSKGLLTRLIAGRCVPFFLCAALAFYPPKILGQDSPRSDRQDKADGAVVGDLDPVPATLPAANTQEDRIKQAWSILKEAAGDARHTQTRIQALAAAGLLRTPETEKIIAHAMTDPDLDVRTAAALAAGETKDRNLSTDLRELLDDREPQVAFTAANTLWKMGDHSGEDILMAVVDGDRSASPTLLHGTEHRISRELHDPGQLARLGALEGASMLLGPFGFGITAYEYIRKNGGDLSRVTAIEELAEERTEPVRQELVAALSDKDPAVRAASAKALVDYHDKNTSTAVFALLNDPKYPVRLTAAAAFLRTTGVPGPEPDKAASASSRPKRPVKRTSSQ